MSWLRQLFRAGAVNRGGIVRRKKSDVERMVGLDAVIEYAQQRQFHVVETGDQIIVVCNSGTLKLHC